MAKTPWTDMLKGDELSVILSQEGVDTNIHVNKKTGVKTISAHGITLSYNPRRFREETDTYVAEQLKAHQDYLKLVRGELSEDFGDLNDLLGPESELEKVFHFVPQKATRPWIEIAKLVLAPRSWVRFKTLKGNLRKSVESEKWGLFEYKVIEGIVNYGKGFVDGRLAQSNDQLSEAVRTDLTEWETVQGDLLLLYSSLVNSADNKVQAGQRMYKLLFPNSADSIQ